MRNFGFSSGGLHSSSAPTRAAAGAPTSPAGRPRFSSPRDRARLSFPIALTLAVLAFEAAVALSAFLFI